MPFCGGGAAPRLALSTPHAPAALVCSLPACSVRAYTRCLPTGNVGHAHVGRGRRAPRGPCGRSHAPAAAREQIRDLENARWRAAGPPGGLLARVPGRTRGPPRADCAPEPAGVLAKAGVRSRLLEVVPRSTRVERQPMQRSGWWAQSR